jgi:hypothetical protein
LIDYANAGILKTIDFNREGVYKLVLNSILGLVLLWFLFSLLIWMKFRGIRCCEWLTSLGVAAMPVLGIALFLPITSVLFDIFVCEEAHESTKTIWTTVTASCSETAMRTAGEVPIEGT